MVPDLRDAVLADLDCLRGVFARASLSNEGDRVHLLAHPEALILPEGPVRDGRTRVAVEPGSGVVGFASFRPAGAVAELEDLFVDPPWMRQGVGRALVLDMAAVVGVLGFDALEVTANPHALAFYEALGFVADHLVDTAFYPAPRMVRRTPVR